MNKQKKAVIGIIGSAIKEVEDGALNTAKELGALIGHHGFDVVTGTATGAPHIALLEARKFGSKAIGFSPDSNPKMHDKRHDNANLSDFDSVRFIKGFTKRSLELVSHCDAIIVLGGRMGTLSEFTIAFEENKPIGVLTKTSGIAEHLEDIIKKCNKGRNAPVVFHEDVKKLFEDLIKHIGGNEID